MEFFTRSFTEFSANDKCLYTINTSCNPVQLNSAELCGSCVDAAEGGTPVVSAITKCMACFMRW